MTFLKNRIQRVVQGEIVSTWKEIFSGVPHGSVIGPLLFVIFINDMPNVFENKSELYADDTKILSKINVNNQDNSLQRDLNNASEWSKKWHLSFNTEKCVIKACKGNMDNVDNVDNLLF